MVEPQIVVLDVAGSSPVGHPTFSSIMHVLFWHVVLVLDVVRVARDTAKPDRGRERILAHLHQ